MQESTRSGLWFSPDYSTEAATTLSPAPAPAIQLPQGLTPPPYKEPIQANNRGLNIMIWSNSVKEAQIIESVLHKSGYSNIWYATSYEEGLEKMKKTYFDFFIIDLSIDGVGTKLVKALRSSMTYKNTPMLICTESQLVQDMLNAMKAGANDLICKPINAALLTKKISLHSRMAPAA